MPKERGARQKLQLILVYEVVGWSLLHHEKAKSGCGCGPCGEQNALSSKIWNFFSKLVPRTPLARQPSWLFGEQAVLARNKAAGA